MTGFGFPLITVYLLLTIYTIYLILVHFLCVNWSGILSNSWVSKIDFLLYVSENRITKKKPSPKKWVFFEYYLENREGWAFQEKNRANTEKKLIFSPSIFKCVPRTCFPPPRGCPPRAYSRGPTPCGRQSLPTSQSEYRYGWSRYKVTERLSELAGRRKISLNKTR